MFAPRALFTSVAAALAIALAWHLGNRFLAPAPENPLVPAEVVPPPDAEPIQPIPEAVALDPRKIALGRRLFHDTRLSRDDTIACATCHDFDKGGADGQRRSRGVGGKWSALNAPTVFNAAFNFKQTWNGSAISLEDQIDQWVSNPQSFATTWSDIVGKLERDAGYAAEFAALYGNGIRPDNIKDAIATFERSLITPNSRFDRYLRGDPYVLTADEMAGYRLFRSYGCIACHQGVNVGGNLFQRLGVARRYARGDAQAATPPSGAQPDDRQVFKVPSLRNVAVTAPYFHDGSVSTLEEAVGVMGRYQLGVAIPSRDVALIVEFLRTLTGEYQGKAL